jgi:hypothetical protein
VSNLVERPPRGRELLSTDAVRLAARVTGGPALWFLWSAGSGQDLLPFPPGSISGLDLGSVSPPGRSIELDARLFEETAERWREIPRSTAPERRRTPLGRRLDEIRKRIEASGQPLLSSWEEIDRELAERRGEPLEETDR